MPTDPSDTAVPVFFPTAAEFRKWLRKHHGSATELTVGFWKVGSGRPSMSWAEAVDEALCVGWVDGVRHRIDDSAYTIRFTPRKAGSRWSAVNIARVQALTQEGRMQPRGLEAFAQRSAARSRIYSYEQTTQPKLSAEQEQAPDHAMAGARGCDRVWARASEVRSSAMEESWLSETWRPTTWSSVAVPPGWHSPMH